MALSGCDNGEKVRVTFSLDCCVRQAIAFAATTSGISGEFVRKVMVQTLLERFGELLELPHPAEWLSANGSGYIARETRLCGRYRHGPVPQSNARRSHPAAATARLVR
jgi:putative transposase